MDYGRALRTCRAIRGWQQEDVAEHSGLSASYVSLIEAGKRAPSPKAVSKLARGLGVPEPLLTLLASDLSVLPKGDARTFDHLGRSLLGLLVEAGGPEPRTDRRKGARTTGRNRSAPSRSLSA